jgi:hypothetical protein
MKRLFAVLLIISSLTSCHYFSHRIHGNGVMRIENRTVAPFSRVDVSGGAFELYVKTDSISSVRVEADENLLPYIETYTESGALNVQQKEGANLQSAKRIKIYISSPSYTSFDISGANNLYSENRLTSDSEMDFDLSGAGKIQADVQTPKIKIDASGASEIQLKGQAKDLNIDGSGSTKVNCFDLMTENASIGISGAGNADVFASVKLDIHVSGAGDIRYKGNPAISQSISGAGSIKKVD